MMIKHRFIFGLMTALILTMSHAAFGQEHSATQASVSKTSYDPVEKYDPARDGELDLKGALAEAGRTGRRVLVKVGGEWCIWCHIMDEFFRKHSELRSLAEKNFVILKINFSEENPNTALLSRYPAIEGYPHIFILDQKGKLLQSQETSQLEEGKSYNLGKFMAFIKEWSRTKPQDTGR